MVWSNSALAFDPTRRAHSLASPLPQSARPVRPSRGVCVRALLAPGGSKRCASRTSSNPVAQNLLSTGCWLRVCSAAALICLLGIAAHVESMGGVLIATAAVPQPTVKRTRPAAREGTSREEPAGAPDRMSAIIGRTGKSAGPSASSHATQCLAPSCCSLIHTQCSTILSTHTLRTRHSRTDRLPGACCKEAVASVVALAVSRERP